MISDRKRDHAAIERAVNAIERAGAKHPLERRLIDMAVWWFKNQPRIPDHDVMKRLAFLEKTLEMFLETQAMIVERLQHAESHPSSSLLIPRLEMNGDLTKLG